MVNARKAWVFQRGSSWYAGWYESDGSKRKKSFGAKKTDAKNFAATKTAELIQRISQGFRVREWSQFVDDFKARKLTGLKPLSVEAYDIALRNFERVAAPAKVSEVDSMMIATFVAGRRSESGKKPGSKTSPATINKELRALKRVLRVAHEWKLLREVPKIEFLREPKVGITFVTADQFAELYAACDAATKPSYGNVSPADWWRAFILFGYMTGWRVSELLRVLWEDVDLDAGYAITRAADNKGGKESRVPLHPLVIDHLESIRSFSPEVFRWPDDEKSLWPEFRKIQDKAGVKKVCRKDHVHNDACLYFGFHDLRRGFATANAANLSASQLQILMRHSSYTTTQRYIEMATQAKRSDVVERLAVPSLKLSKVVPS